jgi:mRNA interferase RelE/StbE
MSTSFSIRLSKSIAKDIRRIPTAVLTLIDKRIASLKADPVPVTAKKIHGYENYYRLRVGNYRIVYEVTSTVRIITIIRFGHRKDVYRNL